MTVFGVYGLEALTDHGTFRAYRGVVQGGADGVGAAMKTRECEHADRCCDKGVAFTKCLRPGFKLRC